MANELLIRTCRIYNTSADAAPTDVYVTDGRIVGIEPPSESSDSWHGLILDAAGRTLLPGLIDLHIHGAGGADVLDGAPEALRTMAGALARLGTTSFLATTFLHPRIENRHLPVTARSMGGDWGGANLLGLHLEGPFINVERRGGIPADAIRAPSIEDLEEVLALCGGALRMMTIAPELEGCLEITRALTDRGIIASFGHSAATYEETRAGLAAGIRHVTHLYNAMPSLHHRQPGPLPAIFAAEDVTVQVIGDGTHVHPAIVRFTYQALGAGRFIGITDGMRATGLPEGRYDYGGRDFESRDGVARYLDGTLIGTAMSLLEVARRIDEYTACGFPAAIDSVTSAPARVLGIEDRKGSVGVGRDADLVLLDADGSVWATVIGGTVVYRK